MATMRTSPPPTYILPSRVEMQEVATQVGVKRFAPDLVEDIANLAAGGKINPPSTYRRQVEKWEEEHLPSPDSNGCWWLSQGSTTSNRFEAVANNTEKKMRYHQNVSDFLGSLDIDGLPGATPVEKAMSLLKLLATQKGGENAGGDGQESLPIFSDNENPEATAAKLNEAVDTAGSLTEDEKKLLGEETVSASDVVEKGEDPKQARKLAEDMLSGKEKMIEISRHLDQLSRMQVRRSKKVEPDPEGDDVRFRPMKHLGEIGRIPQSEWALPRPFRMYRHITGQTLVRERCTRIERKQLLYLIIDCSGSMGSGQRIYKAGGILMNRLKAVIAGDAELYVRLFDNGLKQEHHVATPEEAREVMKHFTESNYSGGSTDIPGCAKAAQTRIEEIIAEGAHYRPELVVITDGDDDTSGMSIKDFPGTKLHAFVVECRNQNLTKLAERTGGVGVENM